MKKLEGKIALVTGARQGLGLVFAEAMAEAGAEVYMMTRNLPALEMAARDISQKTGAKCHAFPIDIQDEASVERAAQHVINTTGRLDILINNAALGRGATPLENTELAEWNDTISTNLTGTFLCMKHFGRIMIAQGSGKIINMTSLAARAVFSNACTGAYDCSKAAVACLTRCMAGEWSKYHINVNSISPGFFMTDINRRFIQDNPGFYENSIAAVPCGRWGDPCEVGPLAVYLASADSDYVTGADFPIDGGYTLW
ncbi:MAG: SDR family oxidoreductase [Clostridia bacterium]